MPGFVPAASVVQATLHWTYHGIPGMNVIDCRVAAAFTPNGSIANTVNTAIIAALNVPSMIGILSNTTVYTGITLLDRRTEGHARIPSNNGTFTGGNPVLAHPSQVAMCITKRTDRAGKFFRGRTYLGGFAQDTNNTDGTILAAVGATAVEFMTSVASALLTSGMQPAVHSPFYPERPSHAPSGGMLPEHPESLTDITLWELRDHVWDTQRRRLR